LCDAVIDRETAATHREPLPAAAFPRVRLLVLALDVAQLPVPVVMAVHPCHAPIDLAGLRNEAVRIDPVIRKRQRELPNEGRNGSVRYCLLHPHAAPESHIVFDLLRGCLGFRVIPCGVVIHRFIHDNIVVARFPLPRTGRMGVAVPKEFTVYRFRRK
jgi:hypothetical protein